MLPVSSVVVSGVACVLGIRPGVACVLGIKPGVACVLGGGGIVLGHYPENHGVPKNPGSTNYRKKYSNQQTVCCDCYPAIGGLVGVIYV